MWSGAADALSYRTSPPGDSGVRPVAVSCARSRRSLRMYRAIVAAVAFSVVALAAGAEENPQSLSPWMAPGLAMFQPEPKLAANSNPSYLGVFIRDVHPDRVSELKLKDQHGAEVTMVDRDGPAGKAGLKEHDVIVSFNGKPVDDADDLRR